MRISDWSSDVCSSDLAVCLLAGCIVLGALRDILDKIRHLGWLRGVPALGRGYWGMQLAHLGLAVCALGVVLNSVGNLERELRKIGRASCRERVCRLGEIPVVAVSLTNKKKKEK